MSAAGINDGVSYTAYGEALIGLASQFSNTTVEIEKYNEAIKSGNESAIAAAESALLAATYIGESAEKYGLSAEALEVLAKTLAEEYEMTAQ